MPHESSIGETRVLLSGLGMGESPRWHDGRLWFSDWGTNEVVAVDLEGNAEVMAEGGGGSGWAANWLPDGRILITGAELMRLEPDGSRVRHAELSSVSPYGWSEMTIDGRGNVYVNTINFDFADFNDVIGSGKAPGKIALVTPDGEAREVVGGLAFPNGMVDAGQRHAHRRRVVRSSAHGLRHRSRWDPVEPADVGERHRRRDLHGRRRRGVVQRRRPR